MALKRTVYTLIAWSEIGEFNGELLKQLKATKIPYAPCRCIRQPSFGFLGTRLSSCGVRHVA